MYLGNVSTKAIYLIIRGFSIAAQLVGNGPKLILKVFCARRNKGFYRQSDPHALAACRLILLPLLSYGAKTQSLSLPPRRKEFLSYSGIGSVSIYFQFRAYLL